MSEFNENVETIKALFEHPEKFGVFSTEDLIEFNAEKKILNLKKADEIIQEGATPKGIYCMIKGTAKLFKVGFNGKEQILRFVNEGDIIGYRSILSQEVFGASATAMSNCEIYYVPEKFFIKLLEANPKLAFNILQRIAKDLGEYARTITYLAQKTVRERLAEVLLLLEAKLGTDKDGFINISLTREETANLIGTATESAIRLISEFKQDHLIEVEGRKIKIIEHQKLTKLGHVIL
ncbi:MULTISPECIES: Crp/Fnr family transcriptional regulator [Weeksella]|uniref:Crp/Fnr family transcriptional regulator n=1 Tax=Weeksella TaxID=1013 RepID=UPI0008A24355|nr:MULTISPECIES: Crp/Fnr family transcriptional regulator [Weeksella]MDK7375312.1 Crp/Fnr family transcriptional regulator [Weeksella virosa]OFM84757.1 Crp/Fnr family transcriptional regulator [Weeksella sp. HMSC059D05]SUP53841.1 cAMP regulatory protein [Weeksella virosa]